MSDTMLLLRKESFGGTLFSLTSAKRDYVTEQEFANIAKNHMLPDNLAREFGENGYVHVKNISNNVALGHFTFPDTLYLEVTRACNLKCVHCFNDSGKRLRRELSHPQKLNLINNFAQLGGQEIRFTGGEPMQYKRIHELIASASTQPVRVSIGTNATLITLDRAKCLQDSGLSQAVVSIDGMSQTHNKLRGHRAWQRSVTGIRFLQKCGIFVRINITAMQDNFKEIPEVVRYFHDIGVHIFVRRLLPIGRARHNQRMFLTSSDYEWLTNKLYSYLYESHSKVSGHYMHMPTATPRIALPFKRLSCSIAQRGLVIDPFGNIQLCGFMDRYKTGFVANVRNESLDSIWSRITYNDPISWLNNGLRRHNTQADISTNCYACSA